MRTAVLLLIATLSLAQCATVPDAAPQVARMWRGEVPLPRANEYDAYIRAEGLAKLRAIPGNLGVQMFRRTIGDREEFVVISYWPDLEAIRAYAGEDISRARLMPRDPEFLIDPDPLVRHYRVATMR